MLDKPTKRPAIVAAAKERAPIGIYILGCVRCDERMDLSARLNGSESDRLAVQLVRPEIFERQKWDWF